MFIIALIVFFEYVFGVILVYIFKIFERVLFFIKFLGVNKIIRYRVNNNDFVSLWRDYILNLMMYFYLY